MESALTGRALVWHLSDIVLRTEMDVKQAKNR